MAKECPIIDSLQDALNSVHQLQRNVLTLTRCLRRCRRCHGINCPVLVAFNQTFNQALVDIGREWGLY